MAAADTAGRLPLLVAYTIPNRDACGGHSGGGAGTEAAYKSWIQNFATGIGNRPALVIIEPDSLGDFQCMNQAQRDERIRILAFALQQFKDRAPNTWTYLDAGNTGWTSPSEMAARLTGVGVANAHGFSVNVSNYYLTSASASYAGQVNQHLAAASPSSSTPAATAKALATTGATRPAGSSAARQPDHRFLTTTCHPRPAPHLILTGPRLHLPASSDR